MTISELRVRFSGAIRDLTGSGTDKDGRYWIILPFVYHDGDNIELWVSHVGEELRVTDGGETLQRIDSVDLVPEPGTLRRIAEGNGITEQDGELFAVTVPENLGAVLIDLATVCLAVDAAAYWVGTKTMKEGFA